MNHIIQSNITAIFTLIGTIFGSVLSIFGSWILKKRDLRDRLWEKVLDRRIAAHEDVIELSKTLRETIGLGRDDGIGGIARYPAILASQEDFENWRLKFRDALSRSSTWLNNDLTKELYLLQDYIVNLHGMMAEANNKDVPDIGALVADDFIDFSTRLEKLAFRFFERDLARQRINTLNKWHKYPKVETYKRLDATRLFKHKTEIEALVHPAN